MPFDAAAARAFGRIQAVAPSGRGGAYDRQIAAHAVSLGVTLVTNNEQDFHGIPDVVVENWTRPPSPESPRGHRRHGVLSSSSSSSSSSHGS